MPVIVRSDTVSYTPTEIKSSLPYLRTSVATDPSNGDVIVTPTTTQLGFTTQRGVPKLGLMLVGWGGNNGSTVTAAMLANREKITWNTKTGLKTPNYLGSVTQSSTMRLGMGVSDGEEFCVPMKDVVPMVSPNDIVLGGWDISNLSIGAAMERAAVLDYDLQAKLRPTLDTLIPLPAIFDADFVAANQVDRANNVLPASLTKQEQVDRIRADIRRFKITTKVDKVIVLWTANTERFVLIDAKTNGGSAEQLLAAVTSNVAEISPSTLYAIATILEGCSYISGSPQNTFVPGLIALASRENVFIAGDDFKSGQTKLKSVLVEFLVGAGIKPECIASYNHLGNNDGKNLSAPAQFRSKEISKANVVDDMVKSNKVLYPKPEDKPDHLVVIKYLPFVGDSKRALDEYTCSIFMNGQQTFVIHNTCEDSLLAAPLILDLVILMELMERVTVRVGADTPPAKMHCVASLLSYFTKAPLVPDGTPIVNALFRQKMCIENFLRALVGLGPDSNMLMEFKTQKGW